MLAGTGPHVIVWDAIIVFRSIRQLPQSTDALERKRTASPTSSTAPWKGNSPRANRSKEIISSKNMNIKSQHSLVSWSALPMDVLRLVSIRLHICDHLSFRGVCVTWREAAAAASVKQFNQCSPFLLRDLDVDNNCHSFICPFQGKCARVDLPRWNRYVIHRVVLSSAPTEPNCTVFIFQFGYRAFHFCRVGDDEWKMESVSPAVPMNAIVLKKKLYLLCYPDYSLSDTEATIAAANTATQFELEFVKQPRFPGIESAHLVESGEELLLVIRYIRQFLDPLIRFWVYKRDMRTSSWVPMKKIGNRVLFLGDMYFGYYSASFIATELGCKENQIYFQYRKGYRHIWCIFNKEDSSVKSASWDPFSEGCARDLVMEALRLDTVNNLTVIEVCFSADGDGEGDPQPVRKEGPRLRCCSLSAEELSGRGWPLM
ncbi:hypothetical protein MRB53_032023 [Persea americana]|uniref:Uncharacterized protein n=1 Tax=Persea americana TaxID=3435 RepID=A0ACC2KQL9_PERAE|nr:hypothetical protein MRB53_032023 [Persea americana]